MIKTYSDVEVSLDFMTPNPGRVVAEACSITMKKMWGLADDIDEASLVRFLIRANHGNPLEHVFFRFKISHASRAFLAQITRHRIASYTTSSQHYQDYRDYPMVMSEKMLRFLEDNYPNLMYDIQAVYMEAIDRGGILPQEARQILPNAMAVNILLTVNARSLLNIFNLRLCNRNTDEMRIIVNKMWWAVEPMWRSFANESGPDCISYPNSCRQGKMQCPERIFKELT